MIQFCTQRPEGARPSGGAVPAAQTHCSEGRLRTLGSQFFALLVQAQNGVVPEDSGAGMIGLAASRWTAVTWAVLGLLAMLSVMSWGTFLFKWWAFRRAARQSAQFLEVF